MADLSVIIPARNECYLQKTIDSVLANSQADTEIIVVLDGCWPEVSIPDHPRVTLIHHTEARGQRQSINEAARIARGRFVMKLDAHCAVGPGFDRILMEDHQPGWTMVPRMYNLDPSIFAPRLLDDFDEAVKRHKVHDYMFIGFPPDKPQEMRTLYYDKNSGPGNEVINRRLHRRAALVDETMSCMGCCFFLSVEDFWRTGGCDENHGGWGQQGVEVALKAWLSGGALMVDKRTWFAHWFRGGGGPGFPYPIGGRAIDAARKYSRDLWLNNKWPGQKRTIGWLVEKFKPRGWEGRLEEDLLTREQLDNLFRTNYQRIHLAHRDPTWRGVRVIKLPNDLITYQQVIWKHKPRWIVECGTKFGGSALFFQDMLDMIGEGGRVVTIDKYPSKHLHRDSRVTYLEGSSTDEATLERVRQLVGSDSVMAVLDSDHSRVHVKWELHHYSKIVTPSQYLVVEDCTSKHATQAGPGEAVEWFLGVNRDYVQTNLERQFLIGFCQGGWLRRVR